ncbi:MAG: hypothetical protein AAGF01_19835 [Cyanobacteria bacterium P01_G01_bin.38]
MTNGETRRENVQPQGATPTPAPNPNPAPSPSPAPNPAPEPPPSPETTQAQSEFSDIKRALTDRQADPDPEPGWVLPRVDDKAAFSDPALTNPNPQI